MELHHLRLFLAVAEEGSVTRGAARLFLTQPSVSRQLRSLERSLRARLFERGRAGVTLTPAGRLLEAEARRILSAADRLRNDLDDLNRGHRGRHRRLLLGLHLGPLAAAELTRPIITTFQARRPDARVEIRILPTDDPWGRGHPELDVALSRDGALDTDTVTQLFEQPRTAVVGHSHPLADAERVTAADLAEHNLHENSARGRDAFFGYYDLQDVFGDQRVPRVSTGHLPYTALLAGAAAGGYVSITSGSSARLAGVPGLVILPITDVGPSTVTVAVRRPGSLAEAFRLAAIDVVRDLGSLVPEARRATTGLAPQALDDQTGITSPHRRDVDAP